MSEAMAKAFRNLELRYQNLEAEAQALREELAEARGRADGMAEQIAALRAKVVVLPDVRFSPYVASDRAGNTWAEMADDEAGEWINIERLARLNGKAMSEGLLRRIAAPRPSSIGEEPAWRLDQGKAIEELSTLLDGEPT